MNISPIILFAQSSVQQESSGSMLTGFIVPMVAMVAIFYFIYKIIMRILR